MHLILRGGESMQVNVLRAKMMEKNYKIKSLAIEIGMVPTTLYRKLAKNSLTLDEVGKIIAVLDIDKDEASKIFFG